MIGDRVKKVRQYSGLNQTDFGAKIGVSSASISKIEKGINNPADRTLRLISSEFGISRHWLETGEGDMIDPRALEDIEMLVKAMEGHSEAKKNIIRAVAAMPDDLLELAYPYLKRILDQ